MKEALWDWADVAALGYHNRLAPRQLMCCLPGSVGTMWRRRVARMLREVYRDGQRRQRPRQRNEAM